MNKLLQLPIFLSSTNTTSSLASAGSFSWTLSPPLILKNISFPKIGLQKLQFYNWFKNIFANNDISPQNDTLTVSDGVNTYDIVFPSGNYSILDLNNYFLAQQATLFGSAEVEILGNPVYNLVYLKFLNAGWTVTFGANSPTELLGFNTGSYTSVSAGELIYGQLEPQFDKINTLKIRCSLADGSYDGGDVKNVIFKTSIQASIGSYQENEPNNILWCEASSLQSTISNIYINIIDQSDQPVPITQNIEFILVAQYFK